MNLDAALKRGFPLIVAAQLATAAWFQARGLSALLSATLIVEPGPAPPSPRPVPSFAAESRRAVSAAPIIARNPFDSVTGPLDAAPTPAGSTPSAEPAAETDPLDDPPCDAGQVVLIAEADDPAWSFAMITASGARALLRREGDEFVGRTVETIGWDRVWLTAGETRCQLQLGKKPPPAKAKPPPATPPPAGKAGKGKVPPEIASLIQKVSDREFNVDRRAIDLILEQQATLLAKTRLVPAKEGDKVVGYRLPRVAGDSLLGMLGIKSGDQIRSINGFELTDPQSALQAYTRLRAADRLTLALKRGGQDTTIDVNIR